MTDMKFAVSKRHRTERTMLDVFTPKMWGESQSEITTISDIVDYF